MKKILATFCALAVSIGCVGAVSAAEAPAALGENNVPVVIDAEGLQFNVTIPTQMLVSVDEDNVVTTATELKITNNSAGPIRLSGVKLATVDWNLQEYGEDGTLEFNDKKINSKDFAMRFGRKLENGTINKYSFTPKTNKISEDIKDTYSADYDVNDKNVIDTFGTYDIDYMAKVAPQATPISKGNLGTMTFTFGWDDYVKASSLTPLG